MMNPGDSLQVTEILINNNPRPQGVHNVILTIQTVQQAKGDCNFMTNLSNVFFSISTHEEIQSHLGFL